jgi:hypothetical protein
LPYAAPCLTSLLRNSIENLDLVLLTDGLQDAELLESSLRPHANGTCHNLRIFDQNDADRRALKVFDRFPMIAEFRTGHPCWRKITDPMLYAADDEEIIVIDPDVYFPNRFTFESTPETGIYLMWQSPNCLLPENLVTQAYEAGIRMADHTDIGVCQMRAPPPLAVLEDVLGHLDFPQHARSMHVESIVWAALAQRLGGGYLDPTSWHCYRNTVVGRLSRRLGQGGAKSLRALDVAAIKAFHAGGVAKNWLAEAERMGLFAQSSTLQSATPIRNFVDYPRAKFEAKIRNRRIARRLGLYKVLGSN